MPHVCVLGGKSSGIRRLIDSTVASLEAKGCELRARQEGGDWNSLLTENLGAGLFGGRGIVVVEDAEKLGTMPIKLAPLLEGPDAAMTVLLVCKPDTAGQLFPKECKGKYGVLTAKEPAPWSRERDKEVIDTCRRHGVGIAAAAVQLLKDLFEDTAELASETEKVASYCALSGKKQVSAADVEGLCLSDGNRMLLAVLDGLCDGARARVLESLQALKSRGELLPTVSALHNRARAAFYHAAYPQRREIFARALAVRDYAWRKAASASRLYGKDKLLRFVVALIGINAGEKSGLGAGWRDLELQIVDLMNR